ncbi:MAG: hypothetical protein RBU30_27775, partial [Polyangia bacterium]|nr:hypothetical protein [Polyangia bacterium]
VRIVPGWLDLEGRLVLAHWRDDLGLTPRGTTTGLTLGARLSLARQIALHVLLEDNIGTHTQADLRLLALLDLSFCTAGYCPAGVVLP